MGMSEPNDELLVSSAIQVLLAEKRTSLSMMRSAIAIIALPLTITSALIATSSLYQTERVVHLLVGVMTVNVLLLVLGVALVVRSLARIVRYDRLLHELKRDHPSMSRYLD